MIKKIEKLWENLYGDEKKYLSQLKELLRQRKQEIEYTPENPNWFNKGTVYSLYVDLFAEDFTGLIEKLDYLEELGIKTIWLLPILESPMVDQGFDISNFYEVRSELGSNQDFFNFIEKAHEKNMKIVFDIAVNHTSDQHDWFENARQSIDAKYRDFYIWNEDKNKYTNTRLLLKGVSNSNWTYNEKTDDYYFHRFYDIQPDLNYKNPEVLFEMLKAFTYWKTKGVDGFRMDAAPFLWKKVGTNCENLKETHIVLKIFRRVFDYIGAGTAMIAEANQNPKDVVEYLGDGDECNVVYNFPIMPRIFLAIAENDSSYLKKQLKILDDLKQPKGTAWFTFLRCHDELTLEFVSDKERELMNRHYLKDEKWEFRDGEGISGRLYNLLDKNVQKVLLAYSMLFSVQGTPIIYFGDEIGMENNPDFYKKMEDKYGYKDSRYLNRGPFNETKKEEAFNNEDSKEAKIFRGLQDMIAIKNENADLFNEKPIYKTKNNLFISKRELQNKSLTIINNLSEKEVSYQNHNLKPLEYLWILKQDK